METGINKKEDWLNQGQEVSKKNGGLGISSLGENNLEVETTKNGFLQ